jgi:hypothetical protein
LLTPWEEADLTQLPGMMVNLGEFCFLVVVVLGWGWGQM